MVKRKTFPAFRTLVCMGLAQRLCARVVIAASFVGDRTRKEEQHAQKPCSKSHDHSGVDDPSPRLRELAYENDDAHDGEE